MKLLPRFFAVALLSLSVVQAAPIDFKSEDSIASILRRQAGQAVELRLVSGEKIGGKVDKVGESLVYLTQLTGQEFFEAAVDIESISAVVARSQAK